MTEVFEIEKEEYTFKYNQRARDYIRQSFDKQGSKPVAYYVFKHCVTRKSPRGVGHDLEKEMYDLMDKADEQGFDNEEDNRKADRLAKLLQGAIQTEYWFAYPDRIPSDVLNKFSEERAQEMINEELKKRSIADGVPQNNTDLDS